MITCEIWKIIYMKKNKYCRIFHPIFCSYRCWQWNKGSSSISLSHTQKIHCSPLLQLVSWAVAPPGGLQHFPRKISDHICFSSHATAARPIFSVCCHLRKRKGLDYSGGEGKGKGAREIRPPLLRFVDDSDDRKRPLPQSFGDNRMSWISQISRKSTWSHVARVEIQENKFEAFEKVIFVASTTPVHQQHAVMRECFHITLSVREKKENKEQKNTETFSLLLVFSNFQVFELNLGWIMHNLFLKKFGLCVWISRIFPSHNLSAHLKPTEVSRCQQLPRAFPHPGGNLFYGNSGNSERIKVQHIFFLVMLRILSALRNVFWTL